MSGGADASAPGREGGPPLVQPPEGGVAAVWAQARGGVVGLRGRPGVPWDLPEDRARFAALTRGHGVVLGRVTWDALPAAVRPLPGRCCVVLTRDRGWSAPGAVVAHDGPAALAAAAAVVPGDTAADGRVWVAGGAGAWAATADHLQLLDVTDVDLDLGDADAVRAPSTGPGWVLAERWPAAGWATSRTGLRWRTSRYERRAHPSPPAPPR